MYRRRVSVCSLGACTDCHTSVYISDALICTAKDVYQAIIWPYVWAAPPRLNLLATPFKMHLAIPHHTYQVAPSKSGRSSLGRPCFTSTLLWMPEGSSSLSRWGLVRRLLTFLLYPCRCHHLRQGKACSPTQPSPNVRHCSTNAQLCLACWM